MPLRLLASLVIAAASGALAQAAPPLPEVPAQAPAPPLPDVPAPTAQPERAPGVPATRKLEAAPPIVAPPVASWTAVAGALPTAGGALGGLTLPTLALPQQGRLALAADLDWRRGGDFLFPGSTSQRTGWALAASYGALEWLETFGALWFHSTNLFGPAARRTLGSYGDFDAGIKLALPRRGAFSGGALLQLDVPSGVGGFSLGGTGGRAALLLGWADRVGRVPLSVNASAGYRVDNSGKLQPGQLTTFEAYALELSRYDRVEGGISLLLPFAFVTPAAELELTAPVARQTPLPPGGTVLLARLSLGLQATAGPPGLSWQAGVRLALSRSGRLTPDSLPLAGYSPDAPWQVFAGIAYSFEPKMPRLPRWSRERQPELSSQARPEPAPTPLSAPKSVAKAHVSVLAQDARTGLPVAGAWITWTEGGDPGAITGLAGTARLEHEAGSATLAVAHERYELATQPLQLEAGEDKQVTMLLKPNAIDSIVRGRIAGEDAVPLRAAIAVDKGEARWFEGSFSIQVPHGPHTIVASAPGFTVPPQPVELRPGEVVTQDLVLRRSAGEPTVRLTARGAELARPVPFVSGRGALFPVAFPVLAELAQALSKDGRSFVVEARVEADDIRPGGDLDQEAAALSLERARAAVEHLESKGVPKGRLTPRGGGLAKPGQPLFDVTLPEPGPRASLEHSGASIAIAGAHP